MINWYLQSGKDSDIVTSTRIRMARNIKDMNFEAKLSNEQRENILNKIENITTKIQETGQQQKPKKKPR